MKEKKQLKKTRISIILGDITSITVDAIVNAANSGLQGGGGVDGAIHRKGGPSIIKECSRIGYCAPGTAVLTTAGDLPSKYVIHTVGPIWHGGTNGEDQVLSNAYLSCLKIAERENLRSISFPSISTGIYGYPIIKASTIVFQTITKYFTEHDSSIKEVLLVLFSKADYSIYDNCQV